MKEAEAASDCSWSAHALAGGAGVAWAHGGSALPQEQPARLPRALVTARVTWQVDPAVEFARLVGCRRGSCSQAAIDFPVPVLYPNVLACAQGSRTYQDDQAYCTFGD